MTISVIIPTLNEEACVAATLQNVQRQAPDEVIVADGGSVDRTRDRAGDFADVIRAPRGRAAQMNAGAEKATGDVLLFLHADTHLPPRGLEVIRAEMADPQASGGTFCLRFDRETPLLRFYAACTRLPIPQICFGDRGLFVRREVFQSLGGYPPVPIFEDLEMVRALYRRGGFRFLPQAVTTSARRFNRNGALMQQLRNAMLYSGYFLGVSPRRLAAAYKYTT